MKRSPAAQYLLPDGDTVTLYERDGPRQPREYPVILIETAPIADALDQWWSPHASLIFGDRDIAVWTAVHDITADRVLMPDRIDGHFPMLLADLTGTLLVVSRYGHDARDAIAPGSYFARTVASGDTTLDVFGRPTRALETLPSNKPWEEVAVKSVRSLTEVAPGEVLPVELELENRTAEALKLSVRLMDSEGNVFAQNDVNVEPTVRLGLLVPPDAPAGQYTVGAVLYAPEPMRDLAARDGEAIGFLMKIVVAEP